MRSIVIALVGLLWALTPVAVAKQVKEQGSVKIRHLASGTTSGIHETVTAAIRNAGAWKTFWDRHTANVTPKPALPPVDFNKEMVIGIFDGDKPSGGFTVAVKQVVCTPKMVKVKVATTSPSRGSMVSQVVTQPYDIIAAPQSSGSVHRQDIGGK